MIEDVGMLNGWISTNFERDGLAANARRSGKFLRTA